MKRTTTQYRLDKRHFVMPALALAIASLLAAPLAYSQSATPAAKPAAPATAAKPAAAPKMDAAAKPDAGAKDLMKFSEDGNRALREIRGARIAIFNGDPKNAMELMAKAKTDVAAAEKEAPTFSVKTTVTEKGKPVATEAEQMKAVNVPVDGQIVLADTFVATPEKKARIDKANESFKKGDQKQAIEELRQGEIDVSYTRLMMPLASTHKRLDSAIKLAQDGKYYEANLSLKAIEDGLGFESVTLTETPKKVN